MDRILIIEDNKDVNLLLQEALIDEGYSVNTVFDGVNGKKALKTGEYKLVLLDIMLPYISGDELLRELRRDSDIPVIIISAKDMISTKIDMLKMGADDYITKPFDLGEVSARVEAQLRRVNKNQISEPLLYYKDMTIDLHTKRVTINNKELTLTAKEYFILELLLSNRGKVFSKANIYESVWGETYLGDDNAVKTHMSNLRTKLSQENPNENYIETIWGIGYRLFKEI